jgi:hypothetical protein
MGPDCLLPNSKQLATWPYPEPDKSSPCPIPFFEDLFQYYSSIYACIFQVVSFTQMFQPKPCLHLSSSPYVLHALPISFFLILSPKEYLVIKYRLWSSSLCSLHYSPVTSSLLVPNIFLSTPFLKTLSLHYVLKVSDQVSHPYETTEKCIHLYILVVIFLDNKVATR